MRVSSEEKRRFAVKRSRFPWMISAAALAIVGGGAIYWHAHRAAAPAAAPHAQSAAKVPSAPSRLGELRRYDASIDADGTLSVALLLGKGDAKDAQPIVQRVRGKLVELALDPRATLSLIALRDAGVTFGAERQPSIESALAQGILVQRDARGRIARVRLPKSMDDQADPALRMLAMLVEWTAPEGDERDWKTIEPSVDGDATVHYAIGGSPHGVAPFTRTIDGVASKAAGGLVSNDSGVVVGDVDLDARRLVSAHAELSLEKLNGTAKVVAVRLNATLTRTAEERDAATAVGVLASADEVFADWTALDTRRAAGAHVDEEAARAKLIGGRSLDELLAAVDTRDPLAGARAVLALEAYLKSHPEAVARLAKEIAASERGDKHAQALLHALARDGGPESQRAMVDLVKLWTKAGRATDVLPLLGSTRHPTQETQDSLVAMRADPSAASIASSVDTTLGAMAAQLQGSDPSRADAIAARFEAQLHDAKNAIDMQHVLLALGNTRSERILDLVPAYLSSDDIDIRRAAVFALGRAPDAPDTRSTLERIAANDADEGVRETAMRALGRQGG
jgi:hypothetical protein